MPPKEIKSFGEPTEYTITFTGTPVESLFKTLTGIEEEENSMDTVEKVREHFQKMLDRGMSVDEVEALGWSLEKAKKREEMIKAVIEVCDLVDKQEEEIGYLETKVEGCANSIREEERKRYEVIAQRDKMQERINTLIDSLGERK